ncbi:MAG: type II toxin-antitoxin system VapC family toxin [Vicinamibacteraceae bacterium]|nr:type II toxin-antitoxin system VapC family toxin [Vicinamibacteraceae bacterium]
MFWDTSALVPVLFPEPRSADLAAVLGGDRGVTIWWGTPVECLSATYRRHREVPLPAPVLDAALLRLRALVEDADTVLPTDEVRRRAERLVAAHPLRAGDALQLASALIWCEDQPAGEAFVCLDDRLRDAARREGFTLIPA